jgi:NADPH-dependent 2,4-dienoyl-CoA reductase/sulfur reductase-like enzyme
MPYNIADPGRDINDLIVRAAKVFREKQGIDVRTGYRVESIHISNKTVSGATLEGGLFHFPYDKLLIATGAAPIIPELPGFDLPGVLALKSLEDGRKMKHFIQAHKVGKTVILGMGYIAMEMCEALRARGIDVEMIKPRTTFIPWMNQDLAAVVKQEIEGNGVRLHLGQNVRGIEKTDKGLKVICPDTAFDCEMVLVAVGVRPRSEAAEAAGIALGPEKSISVDKRLLTSDADIYAAGDCADAYHVVTGQKVWIPLALRANRAGWAVADNVMGAGTELQGVAGTAVYKVFGLQVARTGLSMKEAEKFGFEPSEIVIQTRSRAHAHPGASTLYVQMVGDRKSGRLLGVQMVGKEGAAHRIYAPAVALHAGMTVEEFSQTDLGYAPPFGPSWDPMLTAANQLLKEMKL